MLRWTVTVFLDDLVIDFISQPLMSERWRKFCWWVDLYHL